MAVHMVGGRFVNRQSQLELLSARYRAAVSGDGSIVTVAGEAGSGKSRLVAEFCAGLASAESLVALGRCLEYAQSPFAPFLAALSSLIASDPEVLRTAAGIRATLAPLLPELQDADGTTAPIERDKLRQLNALSEALEFFGARRPTVLVLEDVHWADSASLELLLHVPPYTTRSRLMLIVTYRSDELRKGHQLRSVLAKLQRSHAAYRTELVPLTEAETRELIHYALDGRTLPPESTAEICTRAEGNPLFAEELIKTVTQDIPKGAVRPVPTTLREAVHDRLVGLGEKERTLLIHASAIGRTFQAEFFARITDAPVEQVLSMLKHAIDAQFITEQGDGEVYYAFRHGLIREVLHGEMLEIEARPLHHRIALALESSNEGKTQFAELAYHFWQARELQKASYYSERAGDGAFAVFAYRDAITAYDRALAAEKTDDARRAALNRKLAMALHRSGYGERAKHALENALAFYETAGDVERAAQVCLSLAIEHDTLGDSEGHFRLVNEALARVGEDLASPVFFQAHIELLLHALDRWNPTAAQEHVAQAERATVERSPADIVSYLESRALLASCLGQPKEALSYTREAADLALGVDDAPSAVRCWANFALPLAQTGERDLAREGFERAIELIRTKHVGGLTGSWALVYAAYAALYEANLHRARELVRQVLGAGVELPSLQVHLAGVSIPVGLLLEDDELVKRCARKELVEYALRSSNARLVGATSAFIQRAIVAGRSGDAGYMLHRGIDALEKIATLPPTGDADRLLVVAAQLGDEVDATRARALLVRIGETSRVRSSAAQIAMFDAYAAARRIDRAAAALAMEVARQWHEIGWPLHEAQALELAGKQHEALEIYRRVGDLRDTHRLEAEMAPPTRRGRAARELTAREREIVNLLVTGKSNKAIAAVLVLSERTVENHMSSILAKTETISRAELIAKVTGAEGTIKLKGDIP